MTAVPTFAALSPIEARVLAVLVEKQHTVPDTYPMTVNALVSGCNQKTSRDPVMDLTERDVIAALEALRARTLIIESSGGRTMRYAENARRVLGVPNESVALLATLMLRGPQTAAELRANCERLHRFSDVSATEGYLDELAARVQPYVRRLARQPGSREHRWVHLLCGEPSEATLGAADAVVLDEPASTALAALSDRVDRLEAELAALRARLDAH
jgi:uncharacterized protein